MGSGAGYESQVGMCVCAGGGGGELVGPFFVLPAFPAPSTIHPTVFPRASLAHGCVSIGGCLSAHSWHCVVRCAAPSGTGGAVFVAASVPFNVKSSVLEVQSSNFTSCTAGQGGAMSLSGSSVSIGRCVFANSSADQGGGCVDMSAATLARVSSSTFTRCVVFGGD